MNNATSMLLVYVSCENKEQAEKIGSSLIKDKLAACVQITSPVTSLFLWPPKEHTITRVEEVLLVIKTLESKWENLKTTIKKLHTYDTPEVVAVPVAYVSESYIAWLTEELL